MPKVIIAEKDLTNAGEPQFDDYITLFPSTVALSDLGVGQEEYFTSASKFKERLPRVQPESGSTSEVINWSIETKIVYRLLELGMTVLYRVIGAEGELYSYENFWKKYEDKGLYNLRFLTIGSSTSASACNCAIQCAAARGDAVALIPAGTSESVDNMLTFVNSLSVGEITRENGVVENPFKYAAAFAPTFSFKETSEFAEVKEKYPGYFGYLACFAKHTKSFADWFAMAGSVRGKLPFEEVKATTAYGQADIDKLQKRTLAEGETSAKAVNVIANIRPYGDIMWGNRTLFPIVVDEEHGTGLRASSFLNVRNLCCDIKKTLYRAARRFTFEPNSDSLWINFKGAITPLLEQMKSGQGIRGYKIIKETAAQKATLKAIVKIIPIEAVEDFDLTVELSDSISVTE